MLIAVKFDTKTKEDKEETSGQDSLNIDTGFGFVSSRRAYKLQVAVTPLITLYKLPTCHYSVNRGEPTLKSYLLVKEGLSHLGTVHQYLPLQVVTQVLNSLLCHHHHR